MKPQTFTLQVFVHKRQQTARKGEWLTYKTPCFYINYIIAQKFQGKNAVFFASVENIGHFSHTKKYAIIDAFSIIA